jgi:hypothetical protein
MAYPPSNISAVDLFAKLQETPKPHRVVDFPRSDADGNPLCEVAICILSQQESMAAAAAAEKTTRRLLKDSLPGKDEKSEGYDNVYNNAAVIEVLYRACRHPEDIARPFFPAKEAIGDVLTGDELAILMNHYFTVQVELGPIVGQMTNDEVDAWIKKLSEGGSSSQYFLNSLSREALKGFLIAMASQLASYKTDISSATTPQETPTSSS